MFLNGYVRDKNGMPIDKASVEIKGDDFATLYRTESNEEGYYQLDIPASQERILTGRDIRS